MNVKEINAPNVIAIFSYNPTKPVDYCVPLPNMNKILFVYLVKTIVSNAILKLA